MRCRGAWALLLLSTAASSTASCSSTEPARPPEVSPAVPPALPHDPLKRAEMERDLVVVLTRTGPEELDADAPWPITATLVNRGTRPHWFVRSESGSGEGWREPSVYYTAEAETAPGVWRAAPRRDDFWVCARYAENWLNDVAQLAPGESVVLGGFIDPSMMLDFTTSGRVRLSAHYDYDAATKTTLRARDYTAFLPPELQAVGPFALVSAPLEVRVHADTSVELSLVLRRAEVRVRERVTFAALIEASVVNRSRAPVDLGEDFLDSRFHLDVSDGDRGGSLHGLSGPRRLEPGERAALRPVDPELALVSETFGSEAPVPMRLRLRYDGLRPKSGAGELERRRYRTPWVDVHVAP